MILCVAGNPAVDKFFEVDRLRVGEIHRPTRFLPLAGGKGVHVAQVAARLGADAVLTGVLGGHAGRWVAERLAEEGIDGRFVWTAAETRSCLSVADAENGTLTEFYESQFSVSESEWGEVEEIVGSALAESAGSPPAGTSWLAMAGSLPDGAPIDGYARLIVMARRGSVASAVDARGAGLLEALKAEPEVVKINAHEAAEALGRPVAGLEDAVSAARELWGRIGSRGHAAAVTVAAGVGVVDPDGRAWVGRVPAEGRYPVGSGDCFLAGLLVGLEAGDGWPDAVRLALGAAAANAEVPGAGVLDPSRARELAALADCQLLDR